MRERASVCAVAVIVSLWLCRPEARAQEPAAPQLNLVANGDFSAVSAGKPANWESAGDSAFVTQSLRIGRDAGQSCAVLACTRLERQTPSAHAMLAQVGQVKLVKGRMYEFSCRVRSEGLAGRTVSVAITDTKTWTNCGLDSQIPVSGTWKDCRHIFRAARDVGPNSRLQIWFAETGTLYVADVRLMEHRQEDVDFTHVVPAGSGKNLLPNGSFEVGAGGWSSLGAGAGWGNLHRLHGSIEESGGQQGRCFLRIPIGEQNTPVLYFDYYEPVVRKELRPLAASVGWIKLEKGVAYTLSCQLRASEENVLAALGIATAEPAGGTRMQRKTVRVGKQWRRYSLTFRPQDRYAYVLVGPGLDREQRVYIDVDAVQLERGERATEFAPWNDFEFAIEPSQQAGIFFDDATGAIRLRACNHAAAPARVNVSFRVSDFEDRSVDWPAQALEVPAKSTIVRDVKLPPDWRGFYRIAAAANSGGRKQSSELRVAIVPRPAGNDSVCGINHAFASAELIQLASKAGITWYRDWSLKWQHIEPSKGQFHWEVADAQIDRVLREGVSVLPLLPPFPSADWASEAPAGLPTSGYPGVRLRSAWGPKDPRELAGFIDRAVRRYKNRIHVWEFLNEPIYTDYALPADAGRRYGGKQYAPADYVRLLDTASATMRQADPNCRIIGGLGGGPSQRTRDLIEAGILKHIDIFNLHMYPGIRAPETFAGEMDQLLKLMDEHGGRKPIWITEFSYYGADDLPRRPFIPRENSWSEQRLLESERQCADYTIRYIVVMLAHGVQKVFIHSGASGKVNEADYECALFGYGGTPQKLMPALAVLTSVLGPSPRCIGERRSGEVWCVAFETGKNSVLVLWKPDDTGALEPVLPSGPALTWIDGMGRKLSSPPRKLSASPVYLLTRPGFAGTLMKAFAN